MKNKLLIMTLVAVFSLFALATALNSVEETPVVINTEPLEFKTETVAICEDNGDSVYCHDELMVICGDEKYVLPKEADTVNCGDVTLQVPYITAFAVFDKDWKDPRLTE